MMMVILTKVDVTEHGSISQQKWVNVFTVNPSPKVLVADTKSVSCHFYKRLFLVKAFTSFLS